LKTKLEIEAKFKIPLGYSKRVWKAVSLRPVTEGFPITIDRVFTYHRYSIDGTRRTSCNNYSGYSDVKIEPRREWYLINRKTLDPATGFDMEEEGLITLEEFRASASDSDKIIEKLRTKITLMGLCYEFDHYFYPKSIDFETLEIEFDDMDSYKVNMAYFHKFNTLPLFAFHDLTVPLEDVTFDFSYRNKNLATPLLDGIS
jgi:hypothetical protein